MKDIIRQRLKTQRAELSNSAFNRMSVAIAKTVINSDTFTQAKRVGFYHPVRGEADPSSLKELAKEKEFFLPVLSKNEHEGLVFIALNEDTVFKNNKFAIPEPVYDENKVIPGTDLDLVIVPLLGFDKSGNRLGMGGGFYDRCFAFKLLEKSQPTTIGFAYGFQEIDHLEAESWDVPLDMIATESQLIIPD